MTLSLKLYKKLVVSQETNFNKIHFVEHGVFSFAPFNSEMNQRKWSFIQSPTMTKPLSNLLTQKLQSGLTLKDLNPRLTYNAIHVRRQAEIHYAFLAVFCFLTKII